MGAYDTPSDSLAELREGTEREGGNRDKRE